MKFTPYTTLEEALAGTEYIVEANSFEKHTLWDEYNTTNNWEQHLSGWLPKVGVTDERPVCISVLWATINGKFVLFWHPTSSLVDHFKIEEYLKTKCPNVKSCDANNFHQCIQFTKR